MKVILAVLLFVGAAISNSTHPYAWKPNRELIYRYDSVVDFSIPEISANQKSGLRLTSVIRIQAKTDFSLMIKLETPRFFTFNGQDLRHGQVEEPIPQSYKTFLEQPFKVHLRRGIVEAIFVDRMEPVAVTNIKKAILSNINMDLSATRRGEVLSNHIEVLDDQALDQAPLDQTYFTVREQSLHGDCQTSYSVHPLPTYEAMEIEKQMEQQEQKMNQQEHLQGGLSQAKGICQGKKYWQITKTRNFDNCIERPVFQKLMGGRPTCDLSKSSCDIMNHISSTIYVVCGNDIRDFVIRKSVTENALTSSLGWNTKEKFLNQAQVQLVLLKEESITTPMVAPKVERQIKNLIFEYPVESTLSELEKDRIEQESGIRPILPMPDLHSAPKMLVAVNMNKDEIAHQVIDILKRVAKEVFESPESCSSKSDVAGHLAVAVKALRPLSFHHLKYVESRLESQISAHQHNSMRKVIRSLFYDVVSMIGTNPAVMLVKEKLRDTAKVDRLMAVRLIQTTVSNIKTPTQELIRELISLVKTELKQLSSDRTQVYNVAMVHLTNLIHKAYVCPTKTNAFPEKIFGPFGQKDSQVVLDWAQFLEHELNTEQNSHIRLNLITAIGKLGHVRSVQVLAKIISHPHYNEMIRSLAVYSLKKAARLEPALVKPILLTVIDNPAEIAEVRIAAVSVLPFAQPTTAELQKIAVRTWLEPSKNVASFIYSTFKSLSVTKCPDLVLVGERVKPLMTLVKPFVYGIQYSKNINVSSFVQYLSLILNKEFSWTQSKSSMTPVRLSDSTEVHTGNFKLLGPSWTLYTRGMDKLVDTIMKYTKQIAQPSQQVQQELSKISQQINIESRLLKKSPEMFLQVRMFEFENELYLNEERVLEILEKVSETLSLDAQSLSQTKAFELTRATKFLDAEAVGPSDAGFAIFAERSIPVVMALKGSAQMEVEVVNGLKVPKMLKAKVIPVFNFKVEANQGVISPFTGELIGSGVEMAAHYATPLEMTISQKMTQMVLDVKVPDEVQKEMEAFHIFIMPYTVKKDLKKIQPITKSTNVKVILSGVPMKEFKMDIGKPLGVDAKLIAETDAKYTDLYSYWEIIKQHENPLSLLNTFYLPFSVRYTSAKIAYNPITSKTKELSLSLGLAKVSKKNGQMIESIVFPYHLNPTKTVSHMQNIEKTLSEMGHQGSVVALKIDAELKSQSGSTFKSIQTALSFGLKKETATAQSQAIKVVSIAEVKLSQHPVYEIKFSTDIVRPFVSSRWNKEQLVNETLNLLLNGQIEYGYQNALKESVRLTSEMFKTGEQIESVMQSAEYKRCTLEEQQGTPLSHVCELIRHQAASIDAIKAELHMPFDMTKSPIIYKVGAILRAYFFGQLWTDVSPYTPTTSMKLQAMISRTGEEAQIVAEIAGVKYSIVNLRVPMILKGVFPISMRNPLSFNMIQKLTRQQFPASCRVQSQFISTFDNLTYGYDLNDCWHVLFSDRTNQIPVAVLAKRRVPSQLKEVKILAGPVEVVMSPTATPGQLRIVMNIEGRTEVLQVLPGHIKPVVVNGMEIMEVKRYQDNVYLVNAFREGLWVLFDGERLEVSGSYLLKSRSAGLCGDLNGENTADLKTPGQCIMSKNIFAAFSYMIPEATCRGIPAQYKPLFEKEIATCVREEIIPTPLEYLTKIVASKTAELPKPMISQHLVQRQHGQVCISVQKVKVGSKMSQAEIEEPTPVKVVPKRVEYVCYDASLPKVQQLEQLAKSGETLDVLSSGKSIAFSTIVYEPIAFQRQSNQIGL